MSLHAHDRAPAHAPIPQPRRRLIGRIAAPALAVVLLATTLFPAAKTLTRVTPVTVQPVLAASSSTGLLASSKQTQSAATSSSEGDGALSRGRVVQAPGWLEPDPYAVAVTALADSVVQTIEVLEGQSVTAGQVVARLDDADAQLALAMAEANLIRQQAHTVDTEADVVAAQGHWDHPIAQERAVETSRAALTMAQAQLAQLPARIEQAKANAERWRYEQEQIDRALSFEAATEQEAKIVQEQRRAAEAALETTRLEQGVLAARVSEIAALLKAAERDLKLRIPETQALARAKAKHAEAKASLKLAEAQRDEAQLRLDRMTITAPMDGRVLRRMKMPGDKVMLGMDDPHSAHLLHLYDPAKLQVRVDVPLADAALIREGQACEVIVDVLPDNTFRGVVTRITHEADLQKNTLQIKVKVQNPSPVLRPEMLTRVRFLPKQADTAASEAKTVTPQTAHAQATHPRDTVRIPLVCVEDGNRVFAVRQREHGTGIAHALVVEVLTQEAGLATVRGPLNASDWLIENPSTIEDGQRVRYVQTKGGAA